MADHQACNAPFCKRGVASRFSSKADWQQCGSQDRGRTYETHISAAGLMFSYAKPIVKWGRKATGFFLSAMTLLFINTAGLPGLTT